MADLKTTYMGLELKNPLIAGSSGLTHSVAKIKELEKAGIAAVVLKSLFEEQIKYEAGKAVSEGQVGHYYTEAEDYLHNYSKANKVDEYLKLIREAKEATSIPIIASINCVTSSEWINFAQRIQAAGADALELNIFILPSDPYQAGEDNEKVYFDIINKIKKQVSLPVAIKISHYFSSLAKTTLKLSWTGIDGMVLFNRFFSPDIDIDRMKVTPGHVFSSPEEIFMPLRWVAMLSDRVHCDIAASTGIHDGEAVVKQLLAGAKAVQICSVLYQQGFEVIGQMLEFMEKWMDRNGYDDIPAFRGKMSLRKAENPAAYERVQFMKHFAGIE